MVKTSDSSEFQPQALGDPAGGEDCFERQQTKNHFRRLASFVLRRTVEPGSGDDNELDAIMEMFEFEDQAEWYAELYPESVSDFGEAEAMAYASKGAMEEVLSHKEKALEAQHNIGISGYIAESPHVSAANEAEWHRGKVREAVARAERYAKEAQDAHREYEDLPNF